MICYRKLVLGEATLKAGPGNGCVAIEQLTQEVCSLPSAAKALLAEKLVESLEFKTDSAVQAAWTSEVKRRRDAIRSGTIQPISGEQALAQVDGFFSNEVRFSP